MAEESENLESSPSSSADPQLNLKVDGNGSAKQRSETAYPYFGLTKALEIVEAIKKAGGSEAKNTEVMKTLSLTKTTDRLWAYGIPAAVQFGLIERVGRGNDGSLKLTPVATRIVFPADPEEARIAKIAALKTPELYSKLLEKGAGSPVPTKEGLKNILYRDHKILESMAATAAEAFLDSLKDADLISPNNLMMSTDGLLPNASANQKETETKPLAIAAVASDTQVVVVPKDFVIYKCKIGKGKIIEIPLPPTFTKSEATKLHNFLLTQIDDDDSDEETDK